MQASAKVTLPPHKQSASLGATPTPLQGKSGPSFYHSVVDSCSACLQPLPLCRVTATAYLNRVAALSPSIKALILLVRLFIQSYIGGLLILGHKGHWKISDCKVFMRRYSQSRGSRVQMLCPFLCQHLDMTQPLYL